MHTPNPYYTPNNNHTIYYDSRYPTQTSESKYPYSQDQKEKPSKKTIEEINLLEKSVKALERKNNEITRSLEALRLERTSLDNRNNSWYEIDKLKQENQTLKSDNIIFREDINRLTDLNSKLEEDIVRQRSRKYFNLSLALN